MERERRLGAFVLVQRLVAEPVAAAAGREVVERPLAGGSVPRNHSNACVARTPCSGSPVSANAASSASTSAAASSGCSSPRPGAGSSRRRPSWPGSAAMSVARARTRRRASEATRARARRESSRPSAAPPLISACEQPCVVVGELVLEPAPVLGELCARTRRRAGRPAARAGAAAAGRAGRGRGVRARAPCRRRSQRDVAGAAPPTSRVEQIARRPDECGNPCGGEDLAERPDRAADVIADVRLVEPAAVVAHEVAHSAARRSRRAGTRARGRGSTSRPARRRDARARARRPPRRATSSTQ